MTPRDILSTTDKLKDTPAERRHLHAAASTFFTWCVQRQYVTASPMVALKNPVKPGQRDRVLSLDEIKAIWHTDCTLTPIARICILGLMRRTEAFLVQPEWLKGD